MKKYRFYNNADLTANPKIMIMLVTHHTISITFLARLKKRIMMTIGRHILNYSEWLNKKLEKFNLMKSPLK